MKIAIIANKQKCSEDQLYRIKEHLGGMRQHNHKIVGVHFANEAPDGDFFTELPDVVVVLGGDGTIISACKAFQLQQIPILGINFGKLGYLANFRYEEFINTRYGNELEPLVISKRMLLRVMIGTGSNHPCMMAVNDLVIDIGEPFRTTELQVMINNRNLAEIRGDGIIVATPTGSTAYNLSAGGPIIEPEVEGIALTPKNPHRLSFRPLVVRASSDIVIRVPKPEGVYAIIDGQRVFPLAKYDGYVTVDRWPDDLQIVEQTNYWETLREKLHWGC